MTNCAYSVSYWSSTIQEANVTRSLIQISVAIGLWSARKVCQSLMVVTISLWLWEIVDIRISLVLEPRLMRIISNRRKGREEEGQARSKFCK